MSPTTLSVTELRAILDAIAGAEVYTRHWPDERRAALARAADKIRETLERRAARERAS